MLAIRIEKTGGPEVMQAVDVPKPAAGPEEILVRHEAVGLNFIDVYQRIGLYKLPLPATLGLEASGVVEAIGEGVTRFRVGDRVAYNGGQGAYAEYNAVKAERAVTLPAEISSEVAAAALLKGMTAEFLVRRIWPVHEGDWALVHAAAGGVGSILVQWLSHLGVRVIALVGSAEKASAATEAGAEEAMVYGEGASDRVKALTGGRGCKIIYDSVGKDTIELSLACIAKRGLIVSFGNASGAVPPLAPLRLQQAGSAFLTRPTLFDYIGDAASLDDSAAALFEAIRTGAVKIEIGQTFALADVRTAHEALESRRTTGSTVLIPPGA